MLILLIIILSICGINGFDENNESIIKEGKEMYEFILELQKDERHGICWQKALVDFERGCNELAEELQTEVAIRFANCFLAMPNQNVIDGHRDENFKFFGLRYSFLVKQFYTHTYNMCYFWWFGPKDPIPSVKPRLIIEEILGKIKSFLTLMIGGEFTVLNGIKIIMKTLVQSVVLKIVKVIVPFSSIFLD